MDVMELINWCYRAYSAYCQYQEHVTAITFTSTTMLNLVYMANYMRANFPDVPAQLLTPVDFLGVFNMPAAFYLAFLNNHSIHHRGELATYLRPMGAKVPSIYGGSYDEPFKMPEPKTSAA